MPEHHMRSVRIPDLWVYIGYASNISDQQHRTVYVPLMGSSEYLGLFLLSIVTVEVLV